MFRISFIPSFLSNPSLSLRRLSCILIASGLLASFTACSKSSSSKDQGLEESASGISDQDLNVDRARFGDGNIPQAQEGTMFRDVHFDFDSSVVRPDDAQIVVDNANRLKNDPSLRVELEGHCDKRGTAEYNLALGEERAKAVAALLVSRGVSAQSITTISYGSEIPLVPGNSEDAYAQNRRVHFSVYRKKTDM